MEAHSLACITASFVLGLRHGADWDHIAAISDLVSVAKTCEKKSEKEQPAWYSVTLATAYISAHAAAVLALGLLAVCFRRVLAPWIDGVMEKAVGLTLLILGVWVIYSFFDFIISKKQEPLKSRSVLLSSLINRMLNRFAAKNPIQVVPERNNLLSALILGLVHGIGAETASQILLIGTVASASQFLAFSILFSFLIALVLANSLLALVVFFGFALSSDRKPLLFTLSVFSGALSIYVGAVFLLGRQEALRDLPSLLGV